MLTLGGVLCHGLCVYIVCSGFALLIWTFQDISLLNVRKDLLMKLCLG